LRIDITGTYLDD
jgi:hypothetical protein